MSKCLRNVVALPTDWNQDAIRTTAGLDIEDMGIEIAIFDLDDVLCRYDLGSRLRALSRISGKTPRDIRAALWDFGLRGRQPIPGVTRRRRNISPNSAGVSAIRSARAQWIEARRAAIAPWPDMLALTREIAAA